MTENKKKEVKWDLKDLKYAVTNVMERKKSPMASDNSLILLTLSKLGYDIKVENNKISIPLEVFHTFPSFDLIIKCRKMLNGEGKFVPPKEITSRRDADNKYIENLFYKHLK